MRRSRKIRGGDSTISVSTDAVSKLAADANQLAEDLGKLVPSAPAEPAVQSDLSATPNVPAAVVHQPSNVQPGDDASEPVVKSPGPGDNAVSNVQTDAVAPGPGDVASNVQNDAAVPGDNAGSNVQNDAAAGTPSVLGSGSAAADQPSNAAAAPSVPSVIGAFAASEPGSTRLAAAASELDSAFASVIDAAPSVPAAAGGTCGGGTESSVPATGFTSAFAPASGFTSGTAVASGACADIVILLF